MAATVLLVGAGATIDPAKGAARPEPSLARRSPSEIAALVERWSSETGATAADSLAGGLVLHEQIWVDTRPARHRVVRNRVVRVLDGDAPGIGRMELPAPEGFQVSRAEGWVLRADGQLERLARRAVRDRRGEDEGPGTVVLEFVQPRAGDVLGGSLELSAPFPLRAAEWVLSGRLRVVRAQVDIANDPASAYRTAGVNVRESDFSAEVLQRHDGNAIASVLRFRDLPPSAAFEWSCPLAAREPLARVGRYGSYNPRFREWYRNNSWGMVALELDALLRAALLRQGDVRERAAAVTRGLTDDAARAAALCVHVRDTLADVAFGEAGGQLREVEQLLRARQANPWEKGVLLAALMRAADLPVELAWAREITRGPPDDLEPSPWQFTDLLVRSVADPSGWYAPAHPLCPAGQLPASLRGARVFQISKDLAAQHERLLMEIFGMRGEASAFLEQFYRQDPRSLLRHQPITESFPSYLVGQYLYRLETQRWFEFSTTRDDGMLPAGTMDEAVALDPSTGELRMQLHPSGASPIAALVREHGSALRAVEVYVGRRFPGALLLSAEPTPAASAASAGWSVRIGAQAQPPPQSDTWVLAPELVFGEPFLAQWSIGPLPCFTAETAVDLTRVTHLPLPAGWQAIAPVPDFQFEWGPLSYRAEVQGGRGSVALRRRLHVAACNLTGAELRAVHEVARRIADYERVPLRLTRAEEAIRP